jgi:hypothetical protein
MQAVRSRPDQQWVNTPLGDAAAETGELDVGGATAHGQIELTWSYCPPTQNRQYQDDPKLDGLAGSPGQRDSAAGGNPDYPAGQTDRPV